MKTFLALALSLLLTAGLCACGRTFPGETAGSTTLPTEASATLTGATTLPAQAHGEMDAHEAIRYDEDFTITETIYKLNQESVTKEAFLEAEEQQQAKPDAVWYDSWEALIASLS